MGPIRIRWRSAARIGAMAVAVLAGLKLLPGLLEPPDPPPLAADVGLPRGAGKRVEVRLGRTEGRHRRAHRRKEEARRPRHGRPRRATKKKHLGKAEAGRGPQRRDRAAAHDPASAAAPAPPPPVPPAPVVPPLPPPTSSPPSQPEATREFGLP